MKLLRSQVVWGILLILVGVLFLLESLALLQLGAIWAVLFALGGLAFGYTAAENRNNWWAAIPAMALLGVAALIGINVLLPALGDQWGAAVFLGALSLAFWLIYLRTDRQEWWALIPGGVLLSLAAAIALEPFVTGEAFVGLFMLGMGLTFVLVYLLPSDTERMGWALFPAGILALIGIIFLSALTELGNLIWPLVLILVGAYVLIRNLTK